VAARFKPYETGTHSPVGEVTVLKDVRELLFLILHVLIAAPDPGGELTPVRKRVERFIEERMVNDE
jgi:hypothetical protein